MRFVIILAFLAVAANASGYWPAPPAYCNELCKRSVGWDKVTPYQYKIVPFFPPRSRWPVGQIYLDNVRTNFVQIAWEEQQPMIKALAVAQGALSSPLCEFQLGQSLKQEACYATIWQFCGRQIKGAYGFVYQSTYKCPGAAPGAPPTTETIKIYSASINGRDRVSAMPGAPPTYFRSWVEVPPTPQYPQGVKFPVIQKQLPKA